MTLLKGFIHWCIDALIDLSSPPVIQNTDGDPIEFGKVYFNLMISLEEAALRLLPLSLMKDVSELLNDAERNHDGKIKKLSFSWSKVGNKKHKSWGNTELGLITIHNSELILEVNSKKRLVRGRKLIENYIKNGVIWKKTESENFQVSRGVEDASGEDNQDIVEEVEQTEELRLFLNQFLAQHWCSWLDDNIPALDGMTPREAAKTEAGRKLLRAILFDFEQGNQCREAGDPLKIDLAFLKTELDME